MNRRKFTGFVMASAVVGLLGAGCGLAGGEDKAEGKELLKCAGINSCSGKGECAAADGSHDCGGKNSCKGKGWVKVTEKECKEKGGEVLGEKE